MAAVSILSLFLHFQIRFIEVAQITFKSWEIKVFRTPLILWVTQLFRTGSKPQSIRNHAKSSLPHML
jgi:hypothetical protein